MDHCLSDNISFHLVLLRFSSAVDDAKVHRSRSHMLTQMVTSFFLLSPYFSKSYAAGEISYENGHFKSFFFEIILDRRVSKKNNNK